VWFGALESCLGEKQGEGIGVRGKTYNSSFKQGTFKLWELNPNFRLVILGPYSDEYCAKK